MSTLHCFVRLVSCLGLLALLGGCATGGSSSRGEWHQYGLVEHAESPPVALGALRGGEENVVIEGTITEVCAMKGCWMRVTDGGDEIFVRFRDYAFFVPRNAAGRAVRLHGDAIRHLASVEELRHYAEDAGAAPAEIAAIIEPKELVMFMADSVLIEGGGLEAPHRQ